MKPKPTPEQAALLREALSLTPSETPPRDIRSARTRWLTASMAASADGRRAHIAAMIERGWLMPVVRAGAPASVAPMWAVTQWGLDALVAGEMS